MNSKIQSLAPVLVVESIEPCLAFWTERLGFQVMASVPEGGRLGFAMLGRDTIVVMYQTRESLRKDIAAVEPGDLHACNPLYFTVENLDEVEARFEGVPRAVPRRTTNYGAQEIGVREPGGTLVLFAQFKK
jgi:hypothetical protein